MKTKLIKLSDTHYVVVDDSEIKEGIICLLDNNVGMSSGFEIKVCLEADVENGEYTFSEDDGYLFTTGRCNVITHSTQTLIRDEERGYTSMLGVKNIPLSDIEEVVNGYSVEKMINNLLDEAFGDSPQYMSDSKSLLKDFYIEGFKAHQELVKDKLFTIEDIRKVLKLSWLEVYDNRLKISESTRESFEDNLIQSLLPKTEWDIEITPEGKIKLI
jgi:hypothetical protein